MVGAEFLNGEWQTGGVANLDLVFLSFFCAIAEREGAHHRQQEAGPKSGQQVKDHCQAETSQPRGEEQQPGHGAGLV